MPYKNKEDKRRHDREYAIKNIGRIRENIKKKYHKCLDCDKLIVPRAIRCKKCNIHNLKKLGKLEISDEVKKSYSERMKRNNPMKNPFIAKKVRDKNIKNGVYERKRQEMVNGGAKRLNNIMIRKGGNINRKIKKTSFITKEFLLKEYVDKCKTIKQISKEYHVGVNTIKSRFKNFKIPINKRYRRKFYCKDCGIQVGYYSERCEKCYHISREGKNIKKKENEMDKFKSFRYFINKINHIEHLRKIGFKKGLSPINMGVKFKKGHKINVGRKKSPLKEKTRIKMSASHQGIPLDKWEGFSSFEPYDENWNIRFKNLIRNRDNQICMNCGIHREKLKRALDIHHINYDKKCTIKENCISLCASCHRMSNFNRKHWIKLFQDLVSNRYGYIYSSNFEPIINIGEING